MKFMKINEETGTVITYDRLVNVPVNDQKHFISLMNSNCETKTVGHSVYTIAKPTGV